MFNRIHKKLLKFFLLTITVLILLPALTISGADNVGPDEGPFFSSIYWVEKHGTTSTRTATIFTPTDNLHTYTIPFNYYYMKRLRQNHQVSEHLRIETSHGYGLWNSQYMKGNVRYLGSNEKAHELLFILDNTKEARLADLKINDVRLPDFINDPHQDDMVANDDINTYTYNHRIPYGSSLNIKAVTVDKNASSSTTEVGTLPTTVTIHVTSADGTVTKDYDINIDYNLNHYLNCLKVDGVVLNDFTYDKNTYDVVLPYGFDTTLNTYLDQPESTTYDAYQSSGFTIEYDGSYTIETIYPITFPGAMTVKVKDAEQVLLKEYTLNLSIGKNTDATLSSLAIADRSVVPFSSSTTSYNHILDYGTSAVPTVSAIPSDSNANFIITPPDALPGTTTIVVTAEDGITTDTYAINFSIAPNTDASLEDLTVDGHAPTNFAKETYHYDMTLAYGTTTVPTIHAIATDHNANVIVTPPASLPGTATVLVTAEDTNIQQTYTVDFALAKNPDSSLSALSINGENLENFHGSTYDYTVVLPYGTTSMPQIEATQTASSATVIISEPIVLPGGGSIVVTAEDTTQTTYTVNFLIAKNTDASLSHFTLDGAPFSGFDSHVLEYDLTMPYGTHTVPTIHAISTDPNALITITPPSSLPGTAIILVTAEDNLTTKTYQLTYTIAPYIYYDDSEEDDEPVIIEKPEPIDPIDKIMDDALLDEEEKTTLLQDVIQDISEDMTHIEDEVTAEKAVGDVNKTLEKTTERLDDLSDEGKKQVVEDIIEVAENLQYALEEMELSKQQVDMTVDTIDYMGQVLKKVEDNTDKTQHLKETIVNIGEKALEKVGNIDLSTKISDDENVVIESEDILEHIAKTVKSVKAIKNELENAVGHELANEIESSITITIADQDNAAVKVATQLTGDVLRDMEDNHIDNLTLDLGKTSFKMEPDTFNHVSQEDDILLEVEQVPLSPTLNTIPDHIEQVADVPVLDLSATAANEHIESFSKPMEVYFDLSHIDVSGYSQEELTSLTVYVYNDIEGSWQAVGGKYNPVTKKIKVFRIHFSKYTVMKSNKSFSDIKEHSAKKEINVLLKKGFLDESDTFNPEKGATREEFIAWISKTLGLENQDAELDFQDVDADSPYYKEIAGAYEAGLIDGRSKTSLAPDAIITREEALKIIGKALAKYDNVSPPTDIEMKLAKLKNDDAISDWAREAVAIAKRERFITDDRAEEFDPSDTLNRAEAATLLYTFYDRT